ncbi:MAG TPA: amidohydrolase [Lachnospiraceae bacterium]|nr:amidohydrolase [Lachnospiraceae bacterium]
MLFKNINILSSNGEIINDVYLAVTDRIISYIGKTAPTQNYNKVFDGTDMLLMPGFVNTHCHVPMTLLRGLGGNLSLSDWLTKAVFPAEAKLTSEYIYYGALLGIAEMIKSGVTSFNDMYYHSNKICSAVLESGINGNIATDGFAFDDSLKSKYSIPASVLYDFHREFNNKNNGQLKIDMCIHSEYTSDPKKVEKLAEIAKNTNSNIQLHLSETQRETTECIKRHGKTPARFFADLGVFNNPTTAAHCVYLNEDDLSLIAEKKVSVAHCPISNLKLGSGIADIVRLQKNGINVTLGTDGAASNDNLNFIEDMKTAILLQKGIHRDASLLSSADIISIATKNGAISQGRTNTAEIAIGKAADFFIMDFNAPNLQPITNMLNGVVYASLPENIVLTMVNGKILYEKGEFKTLDIEKIIAKIKDIKKILY